MTILVRLLCEMMETDSGWYNIVNSCFGCTVAMSSIPGLGGTRLDFEWALTEDYDKQQDRISVDMPSRMTTM